MEKEVVKAVAAFMNTNGGTLLIGVEDDGRVIGLENDYRAWSKTITTDNYFRHLTGEVLKKNFTDEVSTRLCKVEILPIEGKHICRITVQPSERPVFVEYPDKTVGSPQKSFFIRNGASSPNLTDLQEMTNYCINRFK